jgi:hypothetical protein
VIDSLEGRRLRSENGEGDYGRSVEMHYCVHVWVGFVRGGVT